jgi:PIN domain nuclease of toxin-antitoxin system
LRRLLDTHALIWAALEPRKLSKAAREAMERPDAELLVSAVSLWEIGILQSLGRIVLNVSIRTLADLSVSELRSEFIGIDPEHIDRMRTLPFHHRDPFDRLLIAQALSLKAVVVGKDPQFDAYGVERLW